MPNDELPMTIASIIEYLKEESQDRLRWSGPRDSNLTQSIWLNEAATLIESQAKDITKAAEERIKDLERDKAIVDWIEKYKPDVFVLSQFHPETMDATGTYLWELGQSGFRYPTFREAVLAVMEAEAKGEK